MENSKTKAFDRDANKNDLTFLAFKVGTELSALSSKICICQKAYMQKYFLSKRCQNIA
jgi:hypothetical protein